MELNLLIGSDKNTATWMAMVGTGVECTPRFRMLPELKTPELLAINPRGVCPSLKTPEGNLCESIAIQRHFARVSGKMGGKTPMEEAQVDQWISWASAELWGTHARWMYQHLGLTFLSMLDFSVKGVMAGLGLFKSHLAPLNAHLEGRKFLVGEESTIADCNVLMSLYRGFCLIMNDKERAAYPNILAWVKNCGNEAWFVKVYGKVRLSSNGMKYCYMKNPPVFPKAGSTKPSQGKDEQPKKEKKADDGDEPKEKKDKPSEEDLKAMAWFYDYKTLFANAKDKTEAIDKLIKEIDNDRFSVYRSKYDRLPSEGKSLLKSANQLTFFLRGLEGFNKDCLAVTGVYGEDENHDFKGMWLWRSPEIHPRMKDHSSFEYYNFTKMDLTKAEDVASLREYWMNLEEDEGKVEGQLVRNVKVFK